MAAASAKKVLLSKLPNIIFIPLWYKYNMGKWPNLRSPKTLNEKLQWLKIYGQQEEHAILADKFAVRSYVRSVIGEKYLVECLGMWASVEEIEFDRLPTSFVLKTTHDSGGVVICRDKAQFDIYDAKNKLSKALDRNYYYNAREYQYKNIQPRIIAEKFLHDSMNRLPADYKVMCFNGRADNIMVCTNRHEDGSAYYYYFDLNWRPLPYMKKGTQPNLLLDIPKPKLLDELLWAAESLAQNLVVARIDMYLTNEGLKFSEITLCPDAGIDRDITPEADLSMGNKIALPHKTSRKLF